ncbi:unnamed protein product [Gadus morhua 'NCC']
MNSKGSTIIRFCQQLNRPGIGDVLAKYEPEASDKAACVLLLLMAHFKEPKNAIMLEADPFATATDVESTVPFPSKPCLIVQGDMMKPTAWMLSIEQKVLLEHQSREGLQSQEKAWVDEPTCEHTLEEDIGLRMDFNVG